MAGRGEPPEGGAIPGGEDDYGSVVFDESFVKAAPLQELSARERLGPEHRPAVRRRRPDRLPLSKGVRRLSALLVVLLLAFGTAIYLGLQRPSNRPAVYPPPRLNAVLIPLAAPAADPAQQDAAAKRSRAAPFAGTPAEGYRNGADGMPLPTPKGTDHFTGDQVLRALTLSRQYLVAANADPEALLGGGTGKVRALIDPRQFKQFDTSMDSPSNYGQNTATGWLTRFNPNKVALATNDVRVRGSIKYRELNEDYLEISTDHTFTYGLMPRPDPDHDDEEADGAAERPVLPFTVRRELSFQFDRSDLRGSTLRVVQSIAEAGPQSCRTDASSFFRPVFPKTQPAPGASASASGTPGAGSRGAGSPPASGAATPPAGHGHDRGAAGSGGPTPGHGEKATPSGGVPSPQATRPSVPAVNPYDHRHPASDTICGVLK